MQQRRQLVFWVKVRLQVHLEIKVACRLLQESWNVLMPTMEKTRWHFQVGNLLFAAGWVLVILVFNAISTGLTSWEPQRIFQNMQQLIKNSAWNCLQSWPATWREDALAWSSPWRAAKMVSGCGELYNKSMSPLAGRGVLQLPKHFRIFLPFLVQRLSMSISLRMSSWWLNLKKSVRAATPLSSRLQPLWGAATKSGVSIFNSR